MNIEPGNLKDGFSSVEASEEAEVDESTIGKRRKKLFVSISLLVLLIIVLGGGYWFLGGKQVHVKATARPTDQIKSGADLQKAAYDSLKGEIEPPISAGSSPNASPSPTPMIQSSYPGASPQDEIAMTIAPPPKGDEPRRSSEEDGAPSANGSPALNPTKPNVSASITLASLPEPISPKPVSASADKSAPFLNLPIKQLIQSEKAVSAPGFGAMLPVRLMGVLYTLRSGSLVRLELSRDIRAEGWALKRGTVFVGAMLGSDLDRAYVQIRGFIDPETQRFVQLEGELLGNDGGAGLRGKRRRVASVWGRVLDRLAESGTQILTGILGRRNGAIIVTTDPSGTYRAANGEAPSQEQRSFVEVPAGEVGFVLVTALPEAGKTESFLANRLGIGDEAEHLPDADLAGLLAESDPAAIRAALPRMNPELRRIAEMVLREIEASKK